MWFIDWAASSFGGLTFFVVVFYGLAILLAFADRAWQGLAATLVAFGHIVAIPWSIGLLALCAKWGAEQAIHQYLEQLPK